MKLNKSTLIAFLLFIAIASLYRVWADRPAGFAPQMAIAIFGAAIIKDKRLALFLPLLALFISDLIYELLWSFNLSAIPGLYEGQVWNYLIFIGLSVFGFLIRKLNLKNVIGFSISGSVLFFIFSNFAVWIGRGGFQRPLTFEGLLQCYGDALAFYRDYGMITGFVGNQVIGDLFFSLLLVGSYKLIERYLPATEAKAA